MSFNWNLHTYYCKNVIKIILIFHRDTKGDREFLGCTCICIARLMGKGLGPSACLKSATADK